MKFTIGTVCNSLDLSEDLRLIKSSLLYADEIELIGMLEYAVYKYLPQVLLNSKNFDGLIRNMKSLLNSIDMPEKEEFLQKLERAAIQINGFEGNLKKNRHKTSQEIRMQFNIDKIKKEYKELLDNSFKQLLSQASRDDIRELIDKNYITVYDYEFSEFKTGDLICGYFTKLMDIVYSGTAYPLFDKVSTELVSSALKTKVLDIGHLNKEVLQHAGVASSILMTLPTLESASMDELIALKREHPIPLNNFRKAIFEFSEKIQSLPWDADFQYDCLKLYCTEVVPRVQEINEVMTETCVLKNLGRKVLQDEEIRKATGWMGGGLITAVTTALHMEGALAVLRDFILVGGLAGVAQKAITSLMKIANSYSEAKQEAKQNKEKAERNVMYYYYLASQS